MAVRFDASIGFPATGRRPNRSHPMSRLSRIALASTLCCLAFTALAADKSRIANEGAIADEWMLAPGAKLAAPGYTKEMKESGDNVCVALGYAINPDGKTSDFTLL